MINVIVLYSISILDLATTLYFLYFYDNKLPLIRTQYPIVKCPLFGDPIQLVLEYPTI